ncbi:MAG: sugar-transfer associated ATP-grasp domain-containing protein [Lachnospiraceae bacterium]
MIKIARRIVISGQMKLDKQDEDRRALRANEGNLKYAKSDDIDLTEEQKRAIKEYWDRYSFAYDVDYNAFKTFYNRTGVFDVHFIPHHVRTKFLSPYLTPEKYKRAFLNKAYSSKLMKNERHPNTIVRKVEGIYYNTEFERIPKDEAIKICLDKLESGREIVIKPSGKSGGKGVEFMAKATERQLRSMFRKKGRLFVVQEGIRQHEKMASLNESTVNTIRLVTMIHDHEFVPLSALVKVGASSARVDNYHCGGFLIGLDLNGVSRPYALALDLNKVTSLPSGVELDKEPFVVPNFSKVLELAKCAHFEIPVLKMLYWDIAIGEDGEPLIIEANTHGDTRMTQVVTGPLLGEYTDELLDKYILGRYYKRHANYNYNYHEYYDHIEIEAYDGRKKTVKVPAKIKGKPVTAICETAFAHNKSIVKVILPKSITKIGVRAFVSCSSLREINLKETLTNKIGTDAFYQCSSLKSGNKADIVAIRKGGKALSK